MLPGDAGPVLHAIAAELVVLDVVIADVVLSADAGDQHRTDGDPPQPAVASHFSSSKSSCRGLNTEKKTMKMLKKCYRNSILIHRGKAIQFHLLSLNCSKKYLFCLTIEGLWKEVKKKKTRSDSLNVESDGNETELVKTKFAFSSVSDETRCEALSLFVRPYKKSKNKTNKKRRDVIWTRTLRINKRRRAPRRFFHGGSGVGQYFPARDVSPLCRDGRFWTRQWRRHRSYFVGFFGATLRERRDEVCAETEHRPIHRRPSSTFDSRRKIQQTKTIMERLHLEPAMGRAAETFSSLPSTRRISQYRCITGNVKTGKSSRFLTRKRMKVHFFCKRLLPEDHKLSFFFQMKVFLLLCYVLIAAGKKNDNSS